MLLFKENHSNHFSKPWLQKLEWFTVVLLLYFGNIISISVGETSQFIMVIELSGVQFGLKSYE